MPSFLVDAVRDAPPSGHSRAAAMRFRRVLQRRQVRRPLGVRVLGHRQGGMELGGRADGRRTAEGIQSRFQSARCAAQPLHHRRRRVADVPLRSCRSGGVRPHARPPGRTVVHRRQRAARPGVAKSNGDAAVGRLGTDGSERRVPDHRQKDVAGSRRRFDARRRRRRSPKSAGSTSQTIACGCRR